MLPHHTVGPAATQPGARVQTPPRDAGQLGAAVRVEDTLRPTVGGGADHVRQTRAVASRPGHARPG